MIGFWLIAAADCMVVLIIALLLVSGYIANSSLLAEADAARQQTEMRQSDSQRLSEQLRDLSRLHAIQVEIRAGSRVQAGENLDPSKIEARIQSLDAEINVLEANLEPLIRELSALAKQVRALEEEANSYGRKIVDRKEEIETEKLVAELKRLKQDRTDKQRVLVGLEAEVARQAKLTPSVYGKCSRTKSRRSAGRGYFVILAKGKVYPLEKEFFAVSSIQGGEMWIAKKGGLSVNEALAESSPIMQAIKTNGSAKTGGITMLVNSDSFAAYRVLRDSLVADGVDYAWDPWSDGTKVSFVIGGQAHPENQ